MLGEKISFAYVVISLLTIGVLIFLLIRKPETFCSCRQMTQEVCPNTYNQTMLYETGKLTENTDFAAAERNANNPYKWQEIMPEDIFEAQLEHKKTY